MVMNEAVQNCEDILFSFGDWHHDDVNVDNFRWPTALPAMTDGPVWVLVIVSLTFCAIGEGINVNLYIEVPVLPPLTGKMFMYTGDTSVVCAIQVK